jgi:hypothetical protein
MNYYFSKGPPMKEGLRADDIFHLDHRAAEQITFSISYHVATSYVGGIVQ